MYTDKELHKMADEAMSRGDNVMDAAIVAVALAHELGKDVELFTHLMMWNNFWMEHTQKIEGENDKHNYDPARIDPDTVIQL